VRRLVLSLLIILSFSAASASAHRSGCHRWHTCPSDHGTYSVGDPVTPPRQAATSDDAAPSRGGTFTDRVVGVADGDTITVMYDGRGVRVRIHGIDAPEKGQPFGQRAKQFVSDLVFGKDVTVRPVTKDRYGRTVAEVILDDGRSLGEELVRAGLAWWYKRYSNDATLGDLENEARIAKRGLWSDPNPTPPWEFRHASKRAPAP